MDWTQPLQRPEPEKAAPVDPEAYRPIPDRPGWYINGKGQMARQGQIPGPTYGIWGLGLPFPWAR